MRLSTAGVGFCIAEFQADRLPGWEPHSYGYHGDDGHAFQGSGKGRAYGPTYTTGSPSAARRLPPFPVILGCASGGTGGSVWRWRSASNLECVVQAT